MHNYVCEECGAFLDPGEVCDCIKKRKELEVRKEESSRILELEGVLEQQELVFGGTIE